MARGDRAYRGGADHYGSPDTRHLAVHGRGRRQPQGPQLHLHPLPREQVEMVVKGVVSKREIVLWYSRAEGLKLAPGCERVGTSQVVACAQGTTLTIVDDGEGGPAHIQAETGNLQTRVSPGFPPDR